MSEQRCPRCEAVMHELDCLDCVAFDRIKAATPLITQWGTDPAPPKATHCKRGHEWTEANTRIDRRLNRPTAARVCRTCHNERLQAARAMRRAVQRAAS